MIETATSFPKTQAIVVLAHGSKDPVWRENIEAIAKAISQTIAHNQAQQAVPVMCAYIELCQPSFEQVCAQLHETLAKASPKHGVRVDVLPLFLGMGMHTKQDIPRLVQAASSTYPQLHFRMLKSVGETPEVQAAIASAVWAQVQNS